LKRPLAVVGFTYLLTLVVAGVLDKAVSTALGIFCIILALGLLFIKNLPKGKTIPIACITAGIAFLSFNLFWMVNYQPVNILDNKTATISGTIVELPQESYGSFVYIIRLDTIDGKKPTVSTKIRFKSQSKISVQPYDTITAEMNLFIPPSIKGTGYDSKTYYQSKGIYLFGTVQGNISVIKGTYHPPYYYALMTREFSLNALDKMIPGPDGALVKGILLGDVSSIPQEVTDNFRTTGISHLLAVSGTHTSIIGMLLLALFIYLKVPRRLAAIISALGVFGFMAMTGFVPSVSRSGIMTILFMLAIIINRETDAYSSLGIAVLILTLLNPFAAADVGLLLSFCASLGMIVLTPKLFGFLKKPFVDKPKPIVKGANFTCGMLSQTIGATLITLPVIIIVFGQISLISPVTNILTVEPATLLTILAGISSLLYAIPFLNFLAYPFAILAGLIARYIAFVTKTLAHIPYASIPAAYGFILFILAFVIIIFVIYAFLRKTESKGIGICTIFTAILMIIGIFTYQISTKNVLQITMWGAENGECIAVIKDGRAVVIDCGGYYANQAAQKILRDNGIKQLDMLVATNLDKENSSGIADLLLRTPAKAIVIPQSGNLKNEIYTSASRSNSRIVEATSDININNLWSNVNFKIFRADDKKIAVYVKYGEFTMLFAGTPDANLTQKLQSEGEILSDIKAINLFGSDTINTGFINYPVKPKIAMLTPYYTYPSKAASRLYLAGAEVLRTDKTGTISILSRGNEDYMIKEGE
jgi:competence protein ComEC